jgi:phage baseplate assembly protein gpV
VSLANILSRIAEIERKLATLAVPATVHERDHEKGVRFKLADADGQPVLSSWVQPPDANKGTRSRWLPQVGAQALLFTPAGGDRALAFVPMSHHENSPNPASGADDTVIYDDGNCRFAIADGKITLKSGSSVVTIEGDKVEINTDLVHMKGDMVRHNELQIGDKHKHRDVIPGGGVSGIPIE